MHDRKSANKNVGGNGDEDQDDILLEGCQVVTVGGDLTDVTTVTCTSSYSSFELSAQQPSLTMLTSQLQPLRRWNHTSSSGMEPYKSVDPVLYAAASTLSKSDTRVSLERTTTSELSKNPTMIRKKCDSFVQELALHSAKDGLTSSSSTSMSTSTARMRRRAPGGGGDEARDHYRSGEEDDGFEMGNSTESINSTAGAAATVSPRSTYSKRNNSSIWTRLLAESARDGDIDTEDWEIGCDDSNRRKEPTFWKVLSACIRDSWDRSRVRCASTARTLRAHPSILVWSIATCAVILVVGLLVVQSYANHYQEDLLFEATEVATETGAFFSKELDRAILPLFSLAQFVFEVDELRTLPNRIGQAYSPGALPLLPPQVDGGPPKYRNITGVCDDPQLVERFTEIATTIKENAQMGGVLVNLQLAPFATVCLAHPMNNTEDFPPGVYMDNTAVVGHDLLSDPHHFLMAQATIAAHRVVTLGPIPMQQRHDCHPLVEQAFIVRLPIYMDEYSLEVADEEYNVWGFAVALINWKALVTRSNITNSFKSRGMGFELTRVDKIYDADTDSYINKVVLLGNFQSENLNCEVEVDLETTDNKWHIRVGYPHTGRPDWLTPAILGVVLFSLFVFTVVFMVMTSKYAHFDLLSNIFPPKALKKLEKGKTVVEQYKMATVFFSDIVGYTSMASEMRPISVMDMLNQLYDLMDQLADEHDVYKIETIGDAYMVTGGCPDRCTGPEGAEKVASFALAVIEMVKDFKTADGVQVYMRAGLNSGPIVAGVVGKRRPHYTVFGDTVNVAARMESTSKKMRIQCTETTFRLLQEAQNRAFNCEACGGVDVKGKGRMPTWFINSIADTTETVWKTQF